MKNDVLRTETNLRQYFEHLDRVGQFDSEFFLKAPGREFTHWRIIKNDFPYDKIASRHDLLVSRRRFIDDTEISDEERRELSEIKLSFAESQEYDCVIENVKHRRTVPMHYHLHLIKYKNITTYGKHN